VSTETIDGDRKSGAAVAILQTREPLEARIAELESALTFEREERARINQALAAAGMVGTWHGDLRRGIVYGDENFSRLYGVPPAETARGKPLGYYFQFMPPEDQASARQAQAAMLEGRDDFVHEHRIIRPDGAILWVMARGRLTRDASGSPRDFSGVSVDITARKNAERRDAFLLDLETRLRHATTPEEVTFTASEQIGSHLAADRAGYVVLDETGSVGEVSNDWRAPGMPSLAGTHKLEHFSLLKAVLSCGQPSFIADVEQDPTTAGPSAARLRAWSVAASIAIPLIRHGRLAAVFFIHSRVPRFWSAEDQKLCRDVAERAWPAVERVKADQALAVLNATLEIQVKERTAALMAAEETLRQSQKMEAVGQLTGGLAHDFNNLLAGISGSLDLLDRRLAQKRYDELARYLDIARRAADRAASVTHRLLAFSRRQTLDPRPIDVNSLVAGMEELIRRTVGPAIELDVVPGERLWTIQADPHQLENALLNLCINARDAMPNGGTITIETRNVEGSAIAAHGFPPLGADSVLLRIADTGAGMTKEVAERAFDPFFTTKPLGEGTGLGLSMVHGFVHQSGGQAKIVSAPGEGAQILLSLPRYAGSVASAPGAAKSLGAPTAGRGETVLVVDDEPTIRLLILEVLDELGYGVLEADNGRNALAILESSTKIQLLVTDVGLPGGMNGRQLADHALRTRPDMKVLFITGYAETAVADNAALPSGMHLVTKPFSLRTLAKRIKAIIDGP
jgi:PAS domain S-box-containing protein